MAEPAAGVRKHTDTQWVVVTFTKPILWTRTESEVWMLHPRRRYILNANHLVALGDKVATMSELKSSRQYRPLNALTSTLTHASILVERFRDRGIGDLLFLTGPLAYLMHCSGHTAKIALMGLTDRHEILGWSPLLEHQAVLAGPTLLDDLPLYTYHWFVDTATEHDEERDQLTVYDALYKQLGIDPKDVDAQFKRPQMTLVKKDRQDLDMLYYYLFRSHKLDLRQTPYYVFAPLSHATLRSAPYAVWLSAIAEASKARPVVVVGTLNLGQVPGTDMAFGDFNARLTELCKQGRVINLLGETPIRVIAALIERARAVVSLDSGLLYVAQALRVPAVSLWGTHAPAVRLGHDPEYMKLAIWRQADCPAAPCFAYANFPANKCLRGDQQRVCEPLLQVTPKEIVDKLHLVESGQSELSRVKP